MTYEVPGPRQLISNTPAHPENFVDLVKEQKLPATPSSTVRPMTASELLPRLRWANIGWFYHWGTKQYDFTKEKVEPGRIISKLCREIVRSVNWEDVFVNVMSWQKPEIMPEWKTWEKTYG